MTSPHRRALRPLQGVRRHLTAIQDLYKDMGYAYVNVEPRTATHPEDRRVDLDFDVQPGDKVHFERIDIVGNAKTRDKVIRRELRIYEGELFSGTGLRDSKNRVTGARLLRDGRGRPDQAARRTRWTSLVDVKERPTGTFQLGAGFSSYENFVLTGADLASTTSSGWGQSLTLQLQWSADPPARRDPATSTRTSSTPAGPSPSTSTPTRSTTRTSPGGRWAGRMTWGYELAGLSRCDPRHLAARGRPALRHLHARAGERGHHQRGPPRPGDRLRRAPARSGFSLQADKRDNRITPTNGWYGSSAFETAPRVLARQGAVRLGGEPVQPLHARPARATSRSGRASSGESGSTWAWLQALTAEGVPLSELYFVGGVNTIRGYRLQSIAPQALQACANSPFSEVCKMNGEGLQGSDPEPGGGVPHLREGRDPRGGVLRRRQPFPADSYHDPNVSWSLYKSVGASASAGSAPSARCASSGASR